MPLNGSSKTERKKPIVTDGRSRPLASSQRRRPPALLAVPGLAMIGVVLATVVTSAPSGLGLRTSMTLMIILVLGVVLVLASAFYDSCSGRLRTLGLTVSFGRQVSDGDRSTTDT